MPDDPELLRRYAEDHSQEAFAELVRRHLNLVYFASLRRVGGDAHLAEDVTQQVFTALARNAAALSRRPVLTGWLYTTSRFAAARVARAERRRHTREQEAQTMHELTADSPPHADWDRLRPVLDAAMDELNEPDREAVLLRFFEARPFADIGEKLRLSEDAARMRVDRALDKLHGLLTQRGVTSTAAALAIILASQAGLAAPAGLATSVTGTALSGAAAAATLGGGGALVLKLLYFMSTAKTTVVIAVAALLAIGAALYQSGQARQTRTELAAATSRENDLNAKLADLQQRVQAAEQRVATVDRGSADLLQHAQGSVAAGSAAEAEAALPITHDVVEARFKEAQALAKSGQFEAALKEFLWCYDVGMPQVTGYGGVRSSFLLSAIKEMGAGYPAALAALQTRRDQAGQRVIAGGDDADAIGDFSALNRTLGEDGRTLELFDQLPADDRRRRTMANYAYELLVAAQRYGDAAGGHPYGTMSSLFEISIARTQDMQAPNAEQLQKANHDYLVKTTVQDVEVLAGSGDLAHARALAGRLLAYDSSEETKAALIEHVARAGHPELLATAPKP